MSLRERLSKRATANAPTVPMPAVPVPPPRGDASQLPTPTRHTGTMPARGTDAPLLNPIDQLKVELHRKLVDRLDLKALEEIKNETELTQQIRDAVVEFLREEATPLSQADRDEIVEQIVWEITGLGPIEPLMRDPAVSDILINGPRDVYVERRGKLWRVGTGFRNDAHLLAVIDRIVSRVGRRVDESSPMVDARLADGSRVNVIIPPLALDGPVVSIRRFKPGMGIERLVESGALTDRMAVLLAACVHSRLNVVISGGTGSGKTTMLNAMSSFIPTSERIVTVEDAAELQLQQDHVVRLETRPPNVEGRGEVLARDLVKNALRMRPNRIIVGEVRGGEAMDMLQAMNTGHEGSLATLHANTPRDALARLETMLLMAGTTLPVRALREQIASAVDLIVQVTRLSDGTRRVTSITELTGIEGDIISTNEIFEFRRQGVAPDGRILGRFMASGVRPNFSERLAIAGITLPPDMFEPGEAEQRLSKPLSEYLAEMLPAEAATEPAEKLPASVPVGRRSRVTQTTNGDEAGSSGERNDSVLRLLQTRAERAEVDAAATRAELEAARAEVASVRAEVDKVRTTLEEQLATAERLRMDAEARAATAEAAARGGTEQKPTLLSRLRRSGEFRRSAEVMAISPDAEARPQPKLELAAAGAIVTFLEGIDDIRAESGSPRAARAAERLAKRAAAVLKAVGLDEIAANVGDEIRAEEHEIVDGYQGEGARIAEVTQRGYRFDGKVLRRTQVIAAAPEKTAGIPVATGTDGVIT